MANEPRVETAAGWIRGRREAGLAIFRGVPFARAPVGARRFAPPESPEPWAGERDAFAFGAAAPQASDLLLERLGLFPDVEQHEACLTLDVWTPACDGARRPVLVWIHGGAFQSGSGSLPLYDARRLVARGDVVVVTLNYRVGALGFLQLDGMPGFDGASNLGLLDQIAALRFVQLHAARFGGDAANVTVFGESAGAGSIVALLAMPAARGLFRRAIVQSAAPNGMIDAATARDRSSRFLAALGLAEREAARLRDVPAGAILDAQQRFAQDGPWKMDMPFVPVVDGVTLPRFPLAAIADGAGREIDLLVGTTDDEMRLYAYFEAPDSIAEPEVLRRLALELPGDGDAARCHAEFRAIRAARGAPHAPADLLWAIQTEVRLRHHTTRIAELRAAQRAPAFVYRFGWRSPDLHGWLGACHAIDLPFTFGNLDAPGMAAFAGKNDAAAALARDWMDAICAFARSGDPSHPAIGAWPPYDLVRRATLHFGATRERIDAPDEAERRVLASVDWNAVS